MNTRDCQHGVGVVVAIRKRGANIAEADEMQYVWRYAVGLDMTRRDLQTEAKNKGRPWERKKARTGAGPRSRGKFGLWVISGGGLPPLAASFAITCLCSQMFMVAESLVSPL